MIMTYTRPFFIIVFFLPIFNNVNSIYENDSLSEKVNQKNSKVLYSNPKYIKEFNVLTYRISRRSPYLTTINMTLLTPWDNNYLVEIEIYNDDLKLEITRLSFKACDIKSAAWLSNWFRRHSDVPAICPIPAGSYHVLRAELPPKNLPLPKVVPKGLYICHLDGYHVLNSTHRDTLYKMMIELSFNGT